MYCTGPEMYCTEALSGKERRRGTLEQPSFPSFPPCEVFPVCVCMIDAVADLLYILPCSIFVGTQETFPYIGEQKTDRARKMVLEMQFCFPSVVSGSR